MRNPAYTVWHIRLETTGSAKPDHVDAIGSSGVGWMFCREMARYRVSSPRRMLHLSDALARKDTLWPWVSLAMFVATLGHKRHGFLLQFLLNRILFETYKSERCFKHFSFVMDPIDAFPEHLSTTVVPVTLPDKPDALEYAVRQGQVRAGIIYQEPTAKRVFVLFCKDHL
ncbi:uncharacterized protein TNCV_3979261 [Trichonephila clavipes]|nr:uncharacterized protein TNCV_3979261 [Trichonephila clavipes]